MLEQLVDFWMLRDTHFCRGRIFETIEADNGQYDDPQMYHLDFRCMYGYQIKSFYQKQEDLMIDFFAHMEEIDLCWRLRMP